MRNYATTDRMIPSQPRAGSPETTILNCVNSAGMQTYSPGDLVTILSAPGMSGWEDMISRLFQDVHPRIIISYFPPRGVNLVDLVSAYERAKAVTGRRSDPFEKSLTGQFVFTS